MGFDKVYSDFPKLAVFRKNIETLLKDGFCNIKASMEAPDRRIIPELNKECVMGKIERKEPSGVPVSGVYGLGSVDLKFPRQVRLVR